MRCEKKPYAGVTDAVFASVIRKFLESNEVTSLRESTQRSYRYVLMLAENPEALGAIPIDEIESSDVQFFLDAVAENHGRATAQIALAKLSTLDDYARRRKLLPQSITADVEVPEGLSWEEGGGYQDWTDEQIEFARSHVRPALFKAIILAVYTGQRGSDLVRMRWTQLRRVKGRLGIDVRTKKVLRRLWVPLPLELQEEMASWPKSFDTILTAEDGAAWTRPRLSSAWYWERRKPGLELIRDMRIHGLRSTAVVRLIRAGVPDRLICGLIGMNQETVTRYARHAEQEENALAAVYILDENRAKRRDGGFSTG